MITAHSMPGVAAEAAAVAGAAAELVQEAVARTDHGDKSDPEEVSAARADPFRGA